MKTINFGITNYKGLALDSGTHFFGTPVVTEKIAKTKFEKQEMFIGQINLKDLSAFSVGDKFPKAGMLYIFYDTFAHTYSVHFSKTEGNIALDNFNEKFNITGRYTSPLQVFFEAADEVSKFEYGNKLFAELPQLVIDKYPKYKSGYKALITLCPKKFEYFEKGFLTGVKLYSVAVISNSDLEKGKFSNLTTINV